MPVCCGIIGLRTPYLYDNAELTHLLLLSWVGRSVLSMQKVNAVSDSLRDTFTYQSKEAIAALEKLSVRHGDLEARNMTYDDRTGRLMVIDFERSSLIGRKALSVLSPNKRRVNDLEVICARRRSFHHVAWPGSNTDAVSWNLEENCILLYTRLSHPSTRCEQGRLEPALLRGRLAHDSASLDGCAGEFGDTRGQLLDTSSR